MSLTTEPLVYDPYAYEIHEDPYPTYARLREEAPVYRNDLRNFWALSRHEDVMAAFRDSERFSNAQGVSIDPAASGPHAHRTMSFLAMDPPQHGRMRGLVSRAFTPRRVAEMESGIRDLTLRHLGPALDGSVAAAQLGSAAIGAGLGLVDDLAYADTRQRGYLQFTVTADAVKGEYVFVSTVKSSSYAASVGRTITVSAAGGVSYA